MSLTSQYSNIQAPPNVPNADWMDWKWQYKHRIKSLKDFDQSFCLSLEEKRTFQLGADLFRAETTPYYARLLCQTEMTNNLRQITLPQPQELQAPLQAQVDPLAENKHSPTPRIIHRYPDRALFLVTDQCGIYCRYCTRKYFTAKGHSKIRAQEYNQALQYIKSTPAIRE